MNPKIVILLLILALTAYLESPYSILNKNYSYTADEPVKAQPASIEPDEAQPVIKKVLESREKEDGYIVETYEEYEVYKDENGNVIKSVPTGQMDTLKYWDYSNENKQLPGTS